jgi:hypothetical protein
LLSLNSLFAQSNDKFQIKFDKIEIRDDLNTPQFSDRIDKKKNTPLKPWVVIMGNYNVKFANIKMPAGSLDSGKWLDNVEVTWDFLYKPKDAPNAVQSYIKFSETIKYANIGEGDHTSTIFISPVILERYFDKVNLKKDLTIRYSMKVNGQIYLQATTIMFEGKQLEGGELRQAHDFINRDTFKKVDNLLMRRDKTPFRSIQFDQFDTIVED